LSTIEEAGKRLYATEEAKKLRSFREEVFKLIEACCTEIDEILLSKNLKGKCKYIKN
jgi:hypothetical protein